MKRTDDPVKNSCDTADIFLSKGNQNQLKWDDFFVKYRSENALELDEIASEDTGSEVSSITPSESSIVLSDNEEILEFDPNKTYSLSTHSTPSDTGLSVANRSLNSTPEFPQCEINIEKLSPQEMQTKQISNPKKLPNESFDTSNIDCLQETVDSTPPIILYQGRHNSGKVAPSSPHSSFPLLPVFAGLQSHEVPPEVERVITLEYSEFVDTDSMHLLRVLLLARFHRSRMDLAILTPYIEKSISTPYKSNKIFLKTPIRFKKGSAFETPSLFNATPHCLFGNNPRKHSVSMTNCSAGGSIKFLPTGTISNSVSEEFSVFDANSSAKSFINLLPTGSPCDSTDKNQLKTFTRASNVLKTDSPTKNPINLLPTNSQSNYFSKNSTEAPKKGCQALAVNPSFENSINLLSISSHYDSFSKSNFPKIHSHSGPYFSTPIKRKSNNFINKQLYKRSRLEDYEEV